VPTAPEGGVTGSKAFIGPCRASTASRVCPTEKGSPGPCSRGAPCGPRRLKRCTCKRPWGHLFGAHVPSPRGEGHRERALTAAEQPSQVRLPLLPVTLFPRRCSNRPFAKVDGDNPPPEPGCRDSPNDEFWESKFSNLGHDRLRLSGS
jgi:hypothetical protein